MANGYLGANIGNQRGEESGPAKDEDGQAKSDTREDCVISATPTNQVKSSERRHGQPHLLSLGGRWKMAFLLALPGSHLVSLHDVGAHKEAWCEPHRQTAGLGSVADA
jgi:hypothetical protein